MRARICEVGRQRWSRSPQCSP